MRIEFIDKDNGPKNLIGEAEILFEPEDGILAGTKLVGISLWRTEKGETRLGRPGREEVLRPSQKRRRRRRSPAQAESRDRGPVPIARSERGLDSGQGFWKSPCLLYFEQSPAA